MSALGQKQTFAMQTAMSALPPKADMCSANTDVRSGPIADSCNAAKQGQLFDHLVGGNEQVGRYIKAKCLRSLEIDSRLESCWSLNW